MVTGSGPLVRIGARCLPRTARKRKRVTDALHRSGVRIRSLPVGNPMNRRGFVRLGSALALGLLLTGRGLRARASPPEKAIRVGLTPAFLHDQHGLLADW